MIVATLDLIYYYRFLILSSGAQLKVDTKADKSEEDNTIKPAAPQPPRSTIPPQNSHISSYAKVDPSFDTNRIASVSSSLSRHGDEILGYWDQFYTAMDTCITCVAPLFLSTILVLYVFSVVTKSEVFLSIGLVYTSCFLTIMFSYFFAIVPFLFVCNAISKQFVSPQIDNIRFSMLIVLIVAVVLYFKSTSLSA